MSRSADQGQDRCLVTGCSLPASAAFHAALTESAGRCVQTVVIALPPGCAGAWWGREYTERICYTTRCPVAAEVIAHCIGHLALNHCGAVRDGGRFACTFSPNRLTASSYKRIRGLLRDPGASLSRLFTDAEERAATGFADALLTRLRHHPAPARRHPGWNGIFVCIG
jgi:hypothetical protein